jgi:ABC-type molybdate transport system substrate-binding protein
MRRDVRIRTSRPVADPSGDYAMAMFDRMDHAHPGAGPALRAKAMAQLDAPLPPIPAGQNATAALLSSGAVDVAVTYCSATAPVLASAPDLVSVSVPDAFDPDPLFALALLSNRADAARFALLLLSQTGQEAIAQAGLLRLTRP